jgi:phosphoribosyl-ATP pyrophosphohydrolase
MMNQIDILYTAIRSCSGADPESSRTARLLSRGRTKKAKKLGEEATETLIAFLNKDRRGLIEESVDLLYHLTVLWADLEIPPAEIWAEMDRRAVMLGLSEKLPKLVALRRRPRTSNRGKPSHLLSTAS